MDKLNITLKPEQKIFFSSDQHFGHRNVVRFCNRPYADEKEMGTALIENWNSVVKKRGYIALVDGKMSGNGTFRSFLMEDKKIKYFSTFFEKPIDKCENL